MAENGREIVLEILLAAEKEDGYASSLLKDVLAKYDYLDAKEKAFIKRLAEGTVERQIELDYYLNAYSKVPVRKMKPFIRCLLRMSVYQLLFMDAVPDSAVCNEACKLAVAHKFQNLRGFVNGILRNIARNRKKLPFPDKEKEPGLYLSVKYSIPEWIVSLWMEEYGRGVTEKILEGLLEIHPVSIRFTKHALDAGKVDDLLTAFENQGILWQRSPYDASVFLLEKCAGVANLPGFEEGLFTVQDVSSALSVKAAGIKESDFVMDVCAAPGGKSMLAAENAREVLSRDVSEEKASRIEENVSRLGLSNVRIEVHDATDFSEAYEGKADVVLLDVPCSGLGVMGKKRDIKYHVTKEVMKSLETLQRQIVSTCAGYVKPGGTLLYSTCTIHAAENEAMVAYIVRELGFRPVSIRENLPERLRLDIADVNEMRAKEGRVPSVALSEEEKNACIQILPGFSAADGFFFAKFQKDA